MSLAKACDTIILEVSSSYNDFVQATLKSFIGFQDI